MGIREDISAAVDLVAGLECTPRYRQTTETGHAFVQLEALEYAGKFDRVARWRVYVMLPADKDQAESFIDEHAPQLFAVLDGGVGEVLWVDKIAPQFTQFEPGAPALPTLVVDCHIETE